MLGEMANFQLGNPVMNTNVFSFDKHEKEPSTPNSHCVRENGLSMISWDRLLTSVPGLGELQPSDRHLPLPSQYQLIHIHDTKK